MSLTFVRQDITRLKTDIIVNAANSRLAHGSGVCGAIFAAAGVREMVHACEEIGGCETGEVAVTPGFKLPAKYVFHVVGPVWEGGNRQEEHLLRNCYRHALEKAVEMGCGSIAFPLISSGIYGYPKQAALRVATSEIQEFLNGHDIEVTLVLFDRTAILFGEEQMWKIQKFIDDNYVDLYSDPRRMPDNAPTFCAPMMAEEALEASDAGKAMPCEKSSVHRAEKKRRNLDDVVSQLDASFSEALLRIIDEKGFTDVEVYKRANMDRKLFSKVRKTNYKPSKSTAVALAIALHLNLDETLDLLGRAGYTLSHSNRFDVIVEYFITEENYNIYEINEALFAFDEKLLGA